MFVEIARHTYVVALVTLFIIGTIVRQEMAASMHDGIAHCDKKRFGGFGDRHTYNLAFFYSLPAAERKIHQNIGVLLEDGGVRCVAHSGLEYTPPSALSRKCVNARFLYRAHRCL